MRRFERAQAEDLADFLSGETWPYHSVPRIAAADVLRQAADGYYDNSSARTFWITVGGHRVGIARLFDLDDGTPLFDLRITGTARHRGIGTRALHALTAYLFTELPTITRVEATTRRDNVTMRRVLAAVDTSRKPTTGRPGPTARAHRTTPSATRSSATTGRRARSPRSTSTTKAVPNGVAFAASAGSSDN
ncbi:hypothetical protein SaccyDRAFT_1098 [Saccharomonospora cyanea NA-134]|uniref:N-acetyltransferase domain-containing protein n=1 Tax=Saccharomonospora cyanea NA-134 TaxID=882082 RepID=H5XNI1_9PSEU|nr:hypothetical protein SaccyDRAFT_1098 [Saccharomonospora cyanea NA-134]